MSSLVQWLSYSGARKSDGTAVASGKAYFYLPGSTNTQVAVFSDKDGTTLLAQPVSLDSGGRAEVYTSVACRVEIQDSTGTVIRVEDRGNTSAAAQVEVEQTGFTGTSLTTGELVNAGRTDLKSVFANLATSLNGTDGYYKEQSGTSSRPLYKAIGLWVCPSDFGAMGDDATDDTTAFQNAITRAMAANKGVWIEPGTYRITSALAVSGATGAGLVIQGADRGNCTIKNMSTSLGALTIDLLSAIESHIILRNFSITANTTSSGAAITFTNGDGPRLERVGIALHRIGFDVSAVSHAMLEDCAIVSTDSNAAGKGFRLGASSETHKCRVTAATNGIGFSFEGALGRAISCRAAVTTGTGFSLAGADSIAQLCVASGTTNGFSVGAVARAGCMMCSSTDGSTTDFTTNASATSVVDTFNNFTTRTPNEYGGSLNLGPRCQVTQKYRQTSSSTVSFSWTPDPSKGQVQLIVWSGSNSINLTTNNTSTADLKDGQVMDLIIENDNGAANTLSLVWGAQYVASIVVTPVTAAHWIWARFMWRSSNSTWIQVDTSSANIATGGSNIW